MKSRAPLSCRSAIAGLVIALTAIDAAATSTYVSPYGYERTWNAAIRLVRVDNGWKIDEKDDAAGYILFEYRSPESAKATPGSIELVRPAEPGDGVGVLARLPRMPAYHERMVLDELAAKMRREYGDPPPSPPPSRAKPEPSPDADGGPDGA